jgi:hypothetical protein
MGRGDKDVKKVTMKTSLLALDFLEKKLLSDFCPETESLTAFLTKINLNCCVKYF